MRYSGPYSNQIQDYTVDSSNGSARATVRCDAKIAERMLNKVVRIYPSRQDAFVGVVTGVADFGLDSGVAQLNVESLVNLALKEQYRDTTTAHTTNVSGAVSIGASYKGSRWGTMSETDGSTTDDSVSSYIRRCINATKSVIAERYGQGISVQFDGGQIDKTIPILTWQGDTVESIISGLLGSAYDAILEVRGDTLYIRGISYDRVTRYIQKRDVDDISLSTDLNNCTSRVIIDSPDFTGYKSETVTLPSANQVIGLSSLTNNRYTNATVDGVADGNVYDYNFDEQYNCLRYKSDSDPTADITAAYDSRVQADSGLHGSAFQRYQWQKLQAIVDEDLGRANSGNYLSASFDRTGDMSTLANYYSKLINRIFYIGSFTCDNNFSIRVGDIIGLSAFGAHDPSVVMSIGYSSDSNVKTVSFGTISGNAYEEVKSRQKLSEIKYTEKKKTDDRDPRILVPLPSGYNETSSTIQQRSRAILNSFGKGGGFPQPVGGGARAQSGVQGKERPKTSVQQRNEERKAKWEARKNTKQTGSIYGDNN